MKKSECQIRLYGTTNIGPKGQIVLPKEVREKIGLKPGDSVSIIIKNDRFVGIIKNDDMQELLAYINQEGISIQ